MTSAPDYARRFGGIERLYGAGALLRAAAAHVVVVGIGGVGSWAAEALARRRGLAALTKQTATSWPKLRAASTRQPWSGAEAR